MYGMSVCLYHSIAGWALLLGTALGRWASATPWWPWAALCAGLLAMGSWYPRPRLGTTPAVRRRVLRPALLPPRRRARVPRKNDWRRQRGPLHRAREQVLAEQRDGASPAGGVKFVSQTRACVCVNVCITTFKKTQTQSRRTTMPPGYID